MVQIRPEFGSSLGHFAPRSKESNGDDLTKKLTGRPIIAAELRSRRWQIAKWVRIWVDNYAWLAIPEFMESNFATTRWSIVLQAGDAESPMQRQALEKLLNDNWYPLYIYVRRSGKSEPEAEDLIQGFFTKLLEKNLLAKIDGRHRGRFRNFLLVCLKNYINDQWKKESAAKRGGGQSLISIDVDEAKRRYSVEPSHDLTAEKAFQKAWAIDTVHRSLERVRQAWESANKVEQFQVLKVFLLPDEQVPSHAEVASQLEMTRESLKIKIHRLRAEFRRAFCAEVAETLGRHDLLEDEINFLFSALCS